MVKKKKQSKEENQKWESREAQCAKVVRNSRFWQMVGILSVTNFKLFLEANTEVAIIIDIVKILMLEPKLSITISYENKWVFCKIGLPPFLVSVVMRVLSIHSPHIE